MSAALARPLPADAAPAPFAEAVTRAEHGKARVVVTREGRPVAALVPTGDVAVLKAREDGQDSRLAEEALAEEAIARREAEGRPTGTTPEELAARCGITLDPDAA